MSMETKMAGSVENVLSMITSLLAKGIGRDQVIRQARMCKSTHFSSDLHNRSTH
ncbi:hypothetical protein E2C01_080699 [Portunus trituberculatus]|uniref:Uncharacterized protein n=1 Tax=Portunus trituberculatus TaxID=210409 RepID=A0A5B7IMV6_PORTR|nr:hypothetical protein [Portunus trituberculatus]